MAELARLRAVYGLRDDAAIARELKRPVASVVRAAERIFQKDPKKSGPWTASEVLELKRRLGASSTEVIARVLGRTVEEVQTQVLDLGRIQRAGAWTREEVAELKRIYGSRTDDDLSRVFGRSVSEIQRFSAELGLAKDKAFLRRLHGEQATRMPRWRAEELEVIKRCYASESNLEIARRLGRSVKSVVSKAHLLGLEKSPERLSKMGCENVGVRYRPSRGR